MVKFVKINIDWSQQAVGQASICFCSSKMQLPQGKAYTISYYLRPIPPTHQKQVFSNQLPTHLDQQAGTYTTDLRPQKTAKLKPQSKARLGTRLQDYLG